MSKNIGLGCPRCGGSTTRICMITTCRECGWRAGSQNPVGARTGPITELEDREVYDPRMMDDRPHRAYRPRRLTFRT
jgi:hypothetical protein